MAAGERLTRLTGGPRAGLLQANGLKTTGLRKPRGGCQDADGHAARSGGAPSSRSWPWPERLCGPAVASGPWRLGQRMRCLSWPGYRRSPGFAYAAPRSAGGVAAR